MTLELLLERLVAALAHRNSVRQVVRRKCAIGDSRVGLERERMRVQEKDSSRSDCRGGGACR